MGGQTRSSPVEEMLKPWAVSVFSKPGRPHVSAFGLMGDAISALVISRHG